MTMPNIARFDPKYPLALDPFRDIEALFSGRRMRPWLTNVPDEPEIRLEVREDNGVYRVKADIPRARKEDVHVAIDGNVVSISGEITREKEEKKGESVLCSERYYGKQSRTFTLRHDIDDSKAEAKYQDGVLELVLPKKTGSATRELPIK